jgi:phosphoglycolate phosphatase-like HAD superfamily hydrolase
MAFFVFDLDGTLADCSHRLHHLDAKDWRGFFAACGQDVPIPHAIEVMLTLADGHDVEIWSGRSDEVRAETRAWLEINGINPGHLTFMRKAGDRRPDDVVKREFLAKSNRRPDLIFDDRDRVVAMWRAEGIPCFQVAPGAF